MQVGIQAVLAMQALQADEQKYRELRSASDVLGLISEIFERLDRVGTEQYLRVVGNRTFKNTTVRNRLVNALGEMGYDVRYHELHLGFGLDWCFAGCSCIERFALVSQKYGVLPTAQECYPIKKNDREVVMHV